MYPIGIQTVLLCDSAQPQVIMGGRKRPEKARNVKERFTARRASRLHVLVQNSDDVIYARRGVNELPQERDSLSLTGAVCLGTGEKSGRTDDTGKWDIAKLNESTSL
jgi:hypothetical protein